MVTFVRNNFEFGLMVLEQSFIIYFNLILALVANLFNGVESLITSCTILKEGNMGT